jgi:hypothetical protein
MTQNQDQLKHIGDALSVGTVLATIAGWLPAVAALVTIVWTGIRIWETRTVQNLVKRWRK